MVLPLSFSVTSVTSVTSVVENPLVGSGDVNAGQPPARGSANLARV